MTTTDQDSGTRTFKRLSFLALLVAMAISLAMVRALQPATLKAGLLFSGWLLLPYVLLAGIVALRSRDRAAVLANLATILLVAAAGLKLLADVIFFHPDPQGPIALLMVPMLQVAGIVLALPLLHWALRRSSTRRGIRDER